jgi:hypothetical protein
VRDQRKSAVAIQLLLVLGTSLAIDLWTPKDSKAFEGESSLCKKLDVRTSDILQSPNTRYGPANSGANAVDGNVSSVWSNKGRTGEWIEIDLGQLKTICYLDISWAKGVRRENNFSLLVSTHNDTSPNTAEDILWYRGSSTGRLAGPSSFERVEIDDVVARFVKIAVSGNQWNNWAAINELRVHGYEVPSDEKSKFLIAIVRSHVPEQETLINLYEQYLDTPRDISLSKPDDSNLGYTMQLPGQHGVSYFSLQEIRQNAQKLKSTGVDVIEYNLEESYSPGSDLRDPVESVRQAYDITHRNGLKLILTPSMDLTNMHASDFARYTDYYNIMALELQTPLSTTAFREHVARTVATIREQSPDMPITVELTTVRGSLEDMRQNFLATFRLVDGYNIWYSIDADGTDKLKRFLDWFDSIRDAG